MTAPQAAKILYTKYCAEVGATDMPDWETFSANPMMAAESKAWIAAAGALLVDQAFEGMPAQFHTMAVLSKAEMLCNEIEKLPASEKQTALSLAAADVRRQISDLIS